MGGGLYGENVLRTGFFPTKTFETCNTHALLLYNSYLLICLGMTISRILSLRP